MAACPVCSFEEEDADAAVCSVCGSDLEVEMPPLPETAEEPSEQVEEEADTLPVEEGLEEILDELEAPIPGDEVAFIVAIPNLKK